MVFLETQPTVVYNSVTLLSHAVMRVVWVSHSCSLGSKLILVALAYARPSGKEYTGALPALCGL